MKQSAIAFIAFFCFGTAYADAGFYIYSKGGNITTHGGGDLRVWLDHCDGNELQIMPSQLHTWTDGKSSSVFMIADEKPLDHPKYLSTSRYPDGGRGVDVKICYEFSGKKYMGRCLTTINTSRLAFCGLQVAM